MPDLRDMIAEALCNHSNADASNCMMWADHRGSANAVTIYLRDHLDELVEVGADAIVATPGPLVQKLVRNVLAAVLGADRA